jgi:DNA repair exonuclease SbcCD ATPase subunit
MARLTSLSLSNFRRHEGTRIDFNPNVNWFVGPTGAGKTSIVAALAYGFTGLNEYTSGKGVGLDTQVRGGAQAAVIGAVLDDGMEWKRHIPTTKNVSGLQFKIDENLKVPGDAVRALLSARALCEMAGDDQQGLFIRALRSAITDEMRVEALSVLNPELPELGQVWAEHMNEARLAKSPYAFCYEERAGVNRTKRNAEEKVRQLEANAPTSAYDPAESLAQWRAHRDKVVDAIAQGEAQEARRQAFISAHRAWETERDANFRAKEAVKRTGDALANLSERQIAMGSSPPLRTADDIRALIEVAEKEIKSQERAHEKLLKGSQDAQDFTAACPAGTCGKAALPKLLLDISNSDTEGAALRGKREALGRELLTVEERTRAIAEMETKVREAITATNEARALMERTPEPGEEPKWHEQPADLPRLRKQKDEADETLRNLEAQATKQAQVEMVGAQLTAARAELKAAERDALVWQALTDAFDSGGIESKMLAEHVGHVFDRAAASLAKHFGLTLTLNRNPWALLSEKDGRKIPVGQLSWGEMELVNLVLQVELARLVGFPIVVVDRHDVDSSVRVTMLRYMMAQEDLQFIVLSPAVERDEKGKLKKPTDIGQPRVTIFWVEAGTVERARPKPPAPPAQ